MRARLMMAVLFALATLAHAQTVALSAPRLHRDVVLVGGVGITVNTPTVNLTLVQGGVSTPQPVSITTTVSGLGIAETLALTAYFASGTALTTGTGDSISSSLVLGSCSTCIPRTFTAISQSSPFGASSSLPLLNATSLLTVLGGSRTDTLNLEVDLSTSPQTPAGTYTGTLVLAAQIF